MKSVFQNFNPQMQPEMQQFQGMPDMMGMFNPMMMQQGQGMPQFDPYGQQNTGFKNIFMMGARNG
jgi:hypothetical protein